MSDERPILRVGASDIKSETDLKSLVKEDVKKDSPEVQAAYNRAEKKKRLARVLERGMVGDRLQVELPPDVHGEWAPISRIEYYRALGYEIDTQFAKIRSLHSRPELGGLECSVVGDAVYMVQPMEDYLLWEELRAERYKQMNNKPKKDGQIGQQEESNYSQQLDSLTEGAVGVPVIDESKAREARKEEIAAAAQAAMQRSAAKQLATT